MLDFSNYKSILCLNGNLPDVTFFDKNLPIIAADGATNTLMRMGITPQLAIGDLDSIAPEYIDKVTTLYHHDQQYCDFQKSLAYLQENELLPAIIVGMNGGFLDHIINNINVFLQVNSVLYSPPIYGFVMREGESKSFKLPLNTKISLIGIPSANVSTQGLKWNLSQSVLSFPGNNSCFNRSIDEQVEIQILKGHALILIYDENSY